MILIIDNYDSFTYNLVHLVALAAEEYKVVRNDKISIDEIRALNPSGILISPGPGRPEEAGIIEEVIQSMGKHTPILGVCLGMQAMGDVWGADVVHADQLMHGKTSRIYHNGKGVFSDVEDAFTATRYHSLVLDEKTIPDVLEVSARADNDEVMGIQHVEFPVEGIQFHPESYLTEFGDVMINNWIEQCRESHKAQAADRN